MHTVQSALTPCPTLYVPLAFFILDTLQCVHREHAVSLAQIATICLYIQKRRDIV